MKLNIPSIAALATIMALGTGFNVFWKTWGWETPNDHIADVTQVQTVSQSMNTAVLLAIKSNRDEWWCDEQDEYLDELLRLKDSGNNSAAIDQEIREQRRKMEAVTCHRFDKD